MKVEKIAIIDAVTFAFKSMLSHVRLFSLILLTGTVIIAPILGIVGLLNMDFIQEVMSFPEVQELQQCVGTTCFSLMYQSGVPIANLIMSHIGTILLYASLLGLFFIGFDLGFKRIALDIRDKDESTLSALFSCFRLIGHGAVAWIVYSIMMFIGWFLFIIPGMWVMLRFAFFPFFIVDKNAGPIEALKMSYHATAGHIWDMFAFWIVVRLIMYVGYLSLIGIIVAWPLSTLAYAFVYRQLTGKQSHGFFTASV